MAVTQEHDYWTQVVSSMIDKTIGGRYQILEELGRGSYGCLFLGQSLMDNSYVAIKVLCKTGLDHQQLLLQQLEIDIQQTLKHPHILTLHGTVQDDDYLYMVMELCDQGDLFDFVIRSKARQEDLVITAFTQILDAVEHMHQNNVYHRDIKLENVLLKTASDDESLECKVADFGLATRERFNMEFGCGSTTYLAPEHFDGEGEQSLAYDAAASDVWSLGILLLGLMFGRNPWEEATEMDQAYREYKRNSMVLRQQLFPTLSMACYRLLESILSPNAADRPSVTEIKHQFLALDRLMDEDDVIDDDYCYPVDIPTTAASAAAAMAAGKKSDKVSFDSAIFSGTYRTGSGESWSDMVEQDEQLFDSSDMLSTVSSCSFEPDDDDTDMFIHSQEKGSWWL
ncbi:kinase-like domain-containing protein [Fennellomyces sp. T-0311]|nr:kinase-like domain-containing protein [Fennellomyces sp. T-0311]